MPGTLFVLGSYVSALTLRVDRHPVPGETLIGRDFNWGPGGKGFNQAVAAARLGGDVHLAVAVGNDVFAELAMDVLRREPIRSTELVRLQDVHSGVGFVTLTPSGENTIVLDPGANARMSPDRVREMTAKIAVASMFLTQQELPADAVETGLAIARAHGVFTQLNPAPARPLSPTTLANVDLLTPNETEARLLAGLPANDPTPTAEVARRLRALGVRSLVVTMGGDGALVVDDAGETHMPALRLEPVDVTGAGDTFNAALAVGLLAGHSLRAAAARATIAAGYCTQFLGVIDGLPTVAQLEAFGRSHGV